MRSSKCREPSATVDADQYSSGDKPLAEALSLLLNEGVSSLAILDNSSNVIGNISVADVKLLTTSSSLPLLRNTCIHFISVILSTRGMYEGKDTFPVFHVTPMNTLATTVAKLVATKSHRLWVTEPVSPSSSGPPTPSLHSATMAPASSHSTSIGAGTGQHHIVPPPSSCDQVFGADTRCAPTCVGQDEVTDAASFDATSQSYSAVMVV